MPRLKMMLVGLFLALLAALFPSGMVAIEQSPTAEQIEFFEKKVRPVLAANCAKCHNPKARVAELDLTTAEGFRQGGESGPLVNREHPEQSRLLQVIGYQEKLKMPPSGKLKPEEIP